jgi:NAD(P)-dependent dehydrogenase (short-subunit alcohol dehydrogenase family)
VCPGYVRTHMIEGILADRREAEQVWLANQPVGRLGSPEEVAALVVWLCSDAAFAVDGGYTAR